MSIKRFLIRKWYKIYANLIRPITSPILYKVIRNTIYQGSLPNHWDGIKNFNRKNFQDFILRYEYKWDFKSGILDFSSREPNFHFLKKRKWFRDCDDFARMWYWWAQENDYKVWEMLLWKDFKKAHFVTVFQEGEDFVLCNYNIEGKYDSLEQAVSNVEGYDDWLIYRNDS